MNEPWTPCLPCRPHVEKLRQRLQASFEAQAIMAENATKRIVELKEKADTLIARIRDYFGPGYMPESFARAIEDLEEGKGGDKSASV